MKNDNGNIELPSSVFTLLLGSAIAAGGGVSSLLVPGVEKGALQSCHDNSRVALEVTAQHGEELVDIRRRIEDVKSILYERTANRYTEQQADKFNRSQERRDAEQDRRDAELDRRLQYMERRQNKGKDSGNNGDGAATSDPGPQNEIYARLGLVEF